MTPICTLSGTIVDANGKPMPEVGVRIHPFSPRGEPVFVDGKLVAADPLSTTTNDDGHFSVNLIQGLEIILTIEALGFSKQVIVPKSATANLVDL